MWENLEEIDAEILSTVQVGTEKVGDFTGYDSFDQALILYDVATILYLVFVATHISVVTVLAGLLIILHGMLRKHMIREAEPLIRNSEGFANPFAVTRKTNRIINIGWAGFFNLLFTPLCLIDPTYLTIAVWSIVNLAAEYVEACNPRPPKPKTRSVMTPLLSLPEGI